MISARRSIAFIVCICILGSILSLSVGAISPSYITQDYTVSRGLIEDGSIAYLGDTIYEYTSEALCFEFEAYYISNYALSENTLILTTNNPSIVAATIDMVDDTITYVVEHENEVNEYISSILFEQDTFIYTTLSMENDFDLCVELARDITWFTAYSDSNANPEFIIQDVQVNTDEIAVANTSSITYIGDDASIIENYVGYYFSESCLTTVGCYSGKITDTDGDLYGAYVIETFYDDYEEKYYSLIAIWRMSYVFFNETDPDTTDNLTPYMAEGEIFKRYDWFVEYDEATHIADVTTASSNNSYLMTNNFDSMFRIYGSTNRAYISSYYIGSDSGGGANSKNEPSPLILDPILGEQLEWYDYFNSTYVIIRDALESLSDTVYTIIDSIYELINNSSNGYARAVAGCYDRALYKRYSTFFTQAVIENPDGNSGNMYYQVEFDVACINSNSDTHHIRIVQREPIG